jgi:hypothetical protein
VAKAKNRHDFSPSTVEAISKRASYICSNPDCRCLTLCPSESDLVEFINTGRAAHITAASPGGARYDSSLTKEQRSSAENGIFLCAVCADKIDKNQGIDFPVGLLRRWKTEHEGWVAENLNKSPFAISQDELDKKTLILQMGSPTNWFAIEAVRTLRARGWLQDGTLERANLRAANLQDADLSDANLRVTDLSGADLQNVNLADACLEGSRMNSTNLRGAECCRVNMENADLTGADLQSAQGLTDEQLAKANSLLGATMVSGKRYNGRFNLEGDLLVAHLMRVGRSDQSMASFYGVSVKDYQWGQEWNRFSQSPPLMYSPDLEKWYRLNESPESE